MLQCKQNDLLLVAKALYKVTLVVIYKLLIQDLFKN